MTVKSSIRIAKNFFLGFTILLCKLAHGQNATYYQIMQDLQLIKKNFLCDSGQYVNCNMTFFYSMESTPLKFMDSLSGSYKAYGNMQYMRMSNTETIQNDSLVLTIFNDDKVLMEVKKTNPGFSKMGTGLMINSMDSGFISTNVESVNINQKGNQKIMAIKFNATSQYYTSSIIYDAITYVPISLSYIFRQTKNSEYGQPPQDGGLITIRFNGYNRTGFDSSVFNVRKYIQMDQKGKATTQTAFSGYNLVQQEQ